MFMGTAFSNTDTDVKNDIRQLQTPCYILDVEHLDKNADLLLEKFKNSWKGKVIAGYSVKTNSLPWIITHLKKKGFYAEVVSEQEFKLAKYLGFRDDEIILNGPVKSGELLVEALNGGSIVNLDNESEIDYLERNLDKAKRAWKVGLRYNFLLEKECPGETIVGSEYSRFGFCVENGDFGKVVGRIEKISGIEVIGLHGHNSTKSKSLSIFKAIVSKASWLINEYNIHADYVDVGGGFFGDKPGAPTFDEYANAMTETFDGNPDTTLIIEPGASIISSPISYLCQVKNVKSVNDKIFATVDGSRIHIDPMMHGIQFGKKVYESTDKENEVLLTQELCGFTCIETDRLGKINDANKLQVGDRIQFMNCGSYSMTLAPLFISYYPTVYALEDGNYRIIRQAWDETDFMRKCEVSL